jgi:hypothetical protein
MRWKMSFPSSSWSSACSGFEVQYRYQDVSPGTCPRMIDGSGQFSTVLSSPGISIRIGLE